jgi:hypothetical protein
MGTEGYSEILVIFHQGIRGHIAEDGVRQVCLPVRYRCGAGTQSSNQRIIPATRPTAILQSAIQQQTVP